MVKATTELYNDPQPVEYSNESLDRELDAVATVRKIFLGVTGLAVQEFGEKLDEEQESLMKLAVIGSELYASESIVLRTLKAIQDNGWTGEEMNDGLTRSDMQPSLSIAHT